MDYSEKYRELVELSHSDNTEIKEKADVWLIGIGLQGAAELKVSAFLLDCKKRSRLLQQKRRCCYSSDVAKLMFSS